MPQKGTFNIKFCIILIDRAELVFLSFKNQKKRFFKDFANTVSYISWYIWNVGTASSRKIFQWLANNWIRNKIWCTIYRSTHLKNKTGVRFLKKSLPWSIAAAEGVLSKSCP